MIWLFILIGILVGCTPKPEIDEIPEVIEADMLVGNFEIICKVAAPTYNDISEIISKKIRKINGIKSTITINVVNNQGFSK